MNKFKKLLLASSILVATGAANAGYTVNTSDTDAVSFGGYIKIDARHVNGDIGYSNAWYGAGLHSEAADTSSTAMFANESRFNMKYVHGDVMGFIELDFFDADSKGADAAKPASANQIISNSWSPRIRHAFIKYDKFVVGQTWSTFMNTSALAETLDFAGPINGGVFVRQAQVRYTNGGLQLSLENPESYKGDTSADNMPDLVAKYTFKGDWGNVSVAGLVRKLNTADVAAADSTTGLAIASSSETAVGYSIAGRINLAGKDSLRFQYSDGEVGRYVGVVSGTDLHGTDMQQVEETQSYSVNYRHFWTEDTRSTIAYGHAEADLSGLESTQWSVNLIKNLTKQLSVGVEVGNYSDDGENADSDYAQVSLKYVL